MQSGTEAVSSGGVVYRIGCCGPEVLLIRRARSGRWRLPKGHVNAGETLEEAAVREVREEAGVRAEVLASIGQSRYTYWGDELSAQVDKTVHHFLLRPEPNATVSVEPGTFDAGGFFPLEQALEMLPFDNEREAVRAAAKMIGENQGQRGR